MGEAERQLAAHQETSQEERAEVQLNGARPMPLLYFDVPADLLAGDLLRGRDRVFLMTAVDPS